MECGDLYRFGNGTDQQATPPALLDRESRPLAYRASTAPPAHRMMDRAVASQDA